jgi:hypothetical protein
MQYEISDEHGFRGGSIRCGYVCERRRRRHRERRVPACRRGRREGEVARGKKLLGTDPEEWSFFKGFAR